MAMMSPSPLSTPARRTARLVVQALAALLLSLLVALAAAPAKAQVRQIPEHAKLATLKLGIFPDAELNGKAVKLGPGVRIYNQENTIVVPSTIKDARLVVAYVTGSLGEVVVAWILKDAEYQQIRARQKKSG
jgi:hypothetical protein